jgi:transitional endoplasmic reticulum ATPase
LKERIKEKVGGLDSIVDELVNLTYATVLRRSSKHRPSTVLPRGFLFVGSSGTGKTHLASVFAQHCGLKPVMVNAPEIFQSGEGQSELALTRIFEEARYAPSVIVIDELESIASNRKMMGGAIEKRLLAHFLQLLDIFNENSPDSVVIGIASSVSALDPAVVRSKRLEKTFHLPIPSPQARLEILRLAIAKFPKCDVNLLAHRTHGFTGSDLSNLCRQAMMLFLKQNSESEGQTDAFNFSYFESALSVVKASALSAYSTSVPNTSFDELRGISDVIETLKSSILAPFEQQKRFELLGARPPAGVLLYGPSGVGKSKLAMAIASTAKINFLTVNSTELISKVVGQSEQALAQVFKAARAASPCILFLDQVESIARARGSDSTEEQSSDRILSLLLTEMDGIHKSTSESTGHLIVLAATNKPHMLDSAVLRPGRFDHVLFVPPPDLEARKDILDLLASKTPCSDVQPSQWVELAKLTRGYSGADLESLFREASYLALRADINAETVTWNDLLASLNTVPASLIRAPITHPYNSQAGFVFLK